jgi:CheY-like chemotaxis protein
MALPWPVLLIEDDDVDREAVQRCLKPYARHFAITAVADATQALTLLQDPRTHFAVIILDLNLPRMDGFEFLQQLRQHSHFKENVVIVLTGSNNEQDRRRASHYQVAAYLLKEELGNYCIPLIQLLQTYCDNRPKPVPCERQSQTEAYHEDSGASRMTIYPVIQSG